MTTITKTSPTAADIAQLKEGDEVTARFAGDDFTLSGSGRLRAIGGGLALGSMGVRYGDGDPGASLVELTYPTPPATPCPVGQRRRSPGGMKAIRTGEVGQKHKWFIYENRAAYGWMADDDVADWEVIADESGQCERQHLAEGEVPIELSKVSDAQLKYVAVVSSHELAAAVSAAATAELERRRAR